MEDGGADPSPGDTALSSVLCAHGYLMNGGVSHALELLSEDELNSAVAGYRFYGFPEVSDLLIRASKLLASGTATDSGEDALNSEYSRFIPADSTLVERFESHFEASPHAYAPVMQTGG